MNYTLLHNQTSRISLLVFFLMWGCVATFIKGPSAKSSLGVVGRSSSKPTGLSAAQEPDSDIQFDLSKRVYGSLSVKTAPLALSNESLGQAANTVTTVSAASYTSPVAPESIVAAFGSKLATTTEVAGGLPLPTQLAGTTVTVNGQLAQLFFVSPGQINYLIPKDVQPGNAEVVVSAPGGIVSRGTAEIVEVGPGIFTRDQSGKNAPNGYVLKYRNGNFLGSQWLYQSTSGDPEVIDPGLVGDDLYLVLFGTGIRGRSEQGAVRAIIGGLELPVEYAGIAPGNYVGLDQVNVKIPKDLVGKGRVNLLLQIGNSALSNTAVIQVGGRKGVASALKIERLSDTFVEAGSVFSIIGNGFITGTTVQIDDKDADVERLETDQLVVRVPYGASSGQVVVKTPQGEICENCPKLTVTVKTSVSGKFVDGKTNKPLVGVRIVLLPGQDVFASSDKEGVFVIKNIQPGDYIAQVYGEGASLPYPNVISRRVNVKEKADNYVGVVPLTKISDSSYRPPVIANNTDFTNIVISEPIQLKEDGLTLGIQANTSYTYSDNIIDKSIALSRINNSLTPVPVGEGRFSQAIAQVTSIGTKFNPGAKLVFPNQDKYLPNENVDLYRLDQNIQSDEVGTFVKNGTATVSSDGQIIETALDAIKEGSIYLVSNPRPTTTLRGQVRAEDGNVPVGQVQVTARGQQTYTDNSGSFVLKGIQTRQGERFSTRAVMVKADGQTMTGEIGNIEGVISGITSLPNPIILKSQTSNRSPVIIIQNKEIRIIPEKTEEIEFLCYDPDGENVKPYITPQLPWIELKDKSEGRWVIVVKAGLNLGSETYKVKLSANDGQTEPAVIELSVKINGKPVAYGISEALKTEQNTPINIALRGMDPENDPLTYTIVKRPINGALIVNNMPLIRYEPSRGWAGRDTISFKVNDGLVDSDEVTINIEVNENKPPVLSFLLGSTGEQRLKPGERLDIRVNAADAEGQMVIVNYEGQLPEGATFSKESRSGVFSWTPKGEQTGNYGIIFTATDDGTPVKRSEATLYITVVNSPPVLTVPGKQTIQVGIELAFAVVSQDPDKGQALTLGVSGTLPAGASFDVSTGQFKWTPTASNIGKQIVTFVTQDNGTPVMRDSKAVEIEVVASGNNTPRIVVPALQTVIAGQELRFNVTASDPDNGQTVSLSAIGIPSGAKLTQKNAMTWEFSWTPTAAQFGNYVVDFFVTDNGLPALVDARSVVISVVALNANKAPTLTVPGPQIVNAKQVLNFTVTASDPDSEQILSLSATSSPSGTTLIKTSASTWLFAWTPTIAQAGSYTIYFRVTDNGSPVLSETKAVVITVSSLNFTALNFTTASVSETGEVTRFEGKTTQQYEEDLGSGVKLEMVAIPAGSFQMGSPNSETRRWGDEGPQRTVRFSNFVISKYEVTRAQWNKVMGINLQYYTGNNKPIENISWDDVQEFCKRLNLMLGLSGDDAYRLPSEAEWEYAARARTTTPFAFGMTIDTAIVNYYGSGPYGMAPIGLNRNQTVNVGSLGVANGWGLYDMHGNMWEWVEDDYHNTYGGAPADGKAWVDEPRAARRVVRGGAWNTDAVACRSARRYSYSQDFRASNLGFRLARTLR